jgi:pepF/M3 family oligoendopeptidase
MKNQTKPVWDLSCFYPKTSLKTLCTQLNQDIEKFEKTIGSNNLSASILAMQDLEAKLQNALSYSDCLYAQNANDQEAIQFKDHLQTLSASFHCASDIVDAKISALSDAQFTALVQLKELEAIRFPLEEKRRLSQDKLPLQEEALIHALAVDGLHGWYQLYQTHVGKMRISCTLEGKKQLLSVGQIYNHLTHPDRKTRTHLFSQWTNAWGQEKEILAQVLNHIAGFRLNVYEKRGWKSPLKEALDVSRMQEKTLTTMWNVVAKNKSPFVDYLKYKSKLLKLKKLSWHDITAPLHTSKKAFSYPKGIAFIEKAFNNYSPAMGKLVKDAQKGSWIEAENRSGKSPGGFCTPFPLQDQSRIFMTYSDSLENLTTLAHELGHAYHSQAIFDLPPLVQAYPMSLAETASTFAEQILSDALLESSTNPAERIFLLDQRLQRSVIFLMNIHARFLFEKAFYEARQKENISPETLCTLMENAQKTAFCDTLDEYHSYFWAEKLHFYLTSLPFYNFPYTFGYLFSMGIYALKPSPDSYQALLRDTGRMSCEGVAKKHLGVNLTKPTFWEKAVEVASVDAYLFVEEAKKLLRK